MKYAWWVVLCCLILPFGIEAGVVTKVAGKDVFVNIGKSKGIQIGTMMNVYRKKEVESEYGSMKFTTQVFLGRIFAYKVAQAHTVARVKEMSGVIDEGTQKAILKGDLAQPAFVIAADDLFQIGETDLLVSGAPTLRRVAGFIKRFKALKVRIEVHTDSDTKGSVKLSRTQAKLIRDWLVSETDMKKGDFVSVGYGDQKPVADSSTAKGQKANRRVEIVIED